MPKVMERVKKVKEFRASSKRKQTRLMSEKPTTFDVTTIPKDNFLVIPIVSSERRRYIPMGFLDKSCLTSNLVHIMEGANLYHFGILTFNVHMAWMRTICGRLKSDYRYSKDIVYNNFPWPEVSEKDKVKIEETAQAILDARELYPDSSLADLYDETLMQTELLKAHRANDKAVMNAYGFNKKGMTESECVAELMKLYKEKLEILEK